jgi:hypothetical protein
MAKPDITSEASSNFSLCLVSRGTSWRSRYNASTTVQPSSGVTMHQRMQNTSSGRLPADQNGASSTTAGPLA